MAKENQNETRTSIDELNDTLTNAVEQKLQNNKKSIFLAGPTPRGKEVASWRVEAVKKLEELGKKLINETSKWNLERHQNASAKLSKSGDLHQITIEKNGLENWHIQYNSSGLNMKNGQLYTIQFMAKANKPVEIDVSLNQAHDPWQQGGFHKKLNSTTQWQSYSFTTENVITDSNLRLNFGSMGFLKGHKIELKEILIYEGGNTTNIEKQGTRFFSTYTPFLA